MRQICETVNVAVNVPDTEMALLIGPALSLLPVGSALYGAAVTSMAPAGHRVCSRVLPDGVAEAEQMQTDNVPNTSAHIARCLAVCVELTAQHAAIVKTRCVTDVYARCKFGPHIASSNVPYILLASHVLHDRTCPSTKFSRLTNYVSRSLFQPERTVSLLPRPISAERSAGARPR